ncbi:unnamed protein product [Vicia faba]|uniref:Rhodanese domain-containing protein n=1 Tax=Vicia faba TaxID=3906 RepID=A0AAV1A7S5_VICFA|nr:unnamed protein product [Vicia faba]
MASSLLTKILLSPRTIHTSSLFTHHPPILSSFFNKQVFSIRVVSTFTAQNTRLTDWIYKNLKEHDIKVVDASWYMPDEQRNPIQEYQVSHILGALFFDIDGIAYRTTNLPHMLPSETAFAAAVSALGIQNKDGLVVYDGKGLFSAARVWWMFRVFGHDRVWVGPITFETKFQPRLVWTLEQVTKNIEEKSHQQVDARSKFDGIAVEPRKGIRSGHVPGSRCIPFPQILDISQALLPADELKKRFEQEGISLEKSVVTSCGTGVTACILALSIGQLT